MRWWTLVLIAGCAPLCRPHPDPPPMTPVAAVCLAPDPSTGCVEPETLLRAFVAALELAARLVPTGGNE